MLFKNTLTICQIIKLALASLLVDQSGHTAEVLQNATMTIVTSLVNEIDLRALQRIVQVIWAQGISYQYCQTLNCHV